MMDMIVTSAPTWLLVFARMGGLLGMNPLFARRNIPGIVRAGLTFLMTVLIAPNIADARGIDGSLELAIGLLRELFVGFACGFIFQIYYYMIFFAGDLMDTSFGLSMAKIFDAGTNIQMSTSSNLLNILFVLYIFATDSHLLLIRIFTSSFQILPVGSVSLSPDAIQVFFELFVDVFSMALRLAIPFMAAEFVVELAMGGLMKLIPQIHVFVINIQFKILLGIILLLFFASPVAAFLDNYMRAMLEDLQYAFLTLRP